MKSKFEIAFDAITAAFQADENLAAAIDEMQGRWIFYENVDDDYPMGSDDAQGINAADLPCVILRMTDCDWDWPFNVPMVFPLTTLVDIRVGEQDQRKAVRLFAHVLQVICDQADTNWSLNGDDDNPACDKTEVKGMSMKNLANEEEAGGTCWQITFNLTLHLRINPNSTGLFEATS